MHIETDGLVIKEQNVGESDRLITVLTSKYGLIRAFASGGKSIKNKNLAGTGLLAYSDFVFYKGHDAYNVTSAVEKEIFFDLRSNIDNMSIAFYLAELFGELAPETAECEELLKLLLNSLYLLSKQRLSGAQIKSVAELRSVAMSGYAPNLIACEECGTFESDVMYFDVRNGNLHCCNCVVGDNGDDNIPQTSTEYESLGLTAWQVPISISAVTAMRHIVYSESKKVFDFTLTDKAQQELSAVTEAYALEHTDRHFKTLDFLKSLQGI
ncbi:MAG: DNA repair protein RecO [Oscillospiraceae bacterium]|nr:DNA repair protein RecO [Candidatus Limimonas coprohippi]